MQKSKLWAVVAIAMILSIVISGCGTTPASSSSAPAASSSNPASSAPAASSAVSSAPEVKPLPSKITMYTSANLSTTTPAWDTPVGKELQKLSGVELVVEYLVGQDVQQKASLMVASGIYPDLIHSGDSAGTFTNAGAFIKLNDLIDQYGENIKRWYRPKELELAGMQSDGDIYVIPINRPTVNNLYPGAGYYLAYDVLKQNDFPTPKYIEDYKNLIVNYCTANPTYDGQPTIGFTLPTDGSRATALQYGGSRYLSGYPNDGVTMVDQDTLEAKIVMLTDANKQFVKFLNEMWNLGYMDKETFMQKNDQFLAKIASGRVAGVYDQRWGIQNGLNSLEQTGLNDRQLVAFPVTVPGVEREYYRGPYSIAVQGTAISTSCKDPEGVFRFLDLMCGEEAQKLMQWGIEGVHYSYDANGKFQRTDEQWQNDFNVEYRREQGIAQLNAQLPRPEHTDSEQYGKFSDGNWVNPNLNERYNELRYKDYEKQILSDYKINTLCDFFDPSYPAKYQPGWAIIMLLPTDSDEFLAVNKALDTANEWHAKLAQAPTADFEKMYEEYQAALNAINGLSGYEAEATRLTRESAKYYGE